MKQASIIIALVLFVGCTTTTTYHADGSKSVIKGADPAALSAITATALAFAPKAKVIQEKGGKNIIGTIHHALDDEPEITAEELAKRFKPAVK